MAFQKVNHMWKNRETLQKNAKIRGMNATCKQKEDEKDFVKINRMKNDMKEAIQKKQRGRKKRMREALSGFSLFCSHACFDNVDDVVAELLALADYIHVPRTYGVCVLMIVHIVDVLALKLVAIVVYLVLYVE